jgi:hypothetical protein
MGESENPAGATLKVNFWWNDDGTISLVGRDLQGSLMRVSSNPRRADGHPLLHYCLAHCLHSARIETPSASRIKVLKV